VREVYAEGVFKKKKEIKILFINYLKNLCFDYSIIYNEGVTSLRFEIRKKKLSKPKYII